MGKCYDCKHLERHKAPDSIGVCLFHSVTVIDTLCGCKTIKDKKTKEEKYILYGFHPEKHAPEER